MTKRAVMVWCVVAMIGGLGLTGSQAWGQASQTDPQAQVRQNFDALLHYSLIGRWDLAQQHGQALLALNPDPAILLELVQSERYPRAYQQLSELRDDSPVAQIAAQLLSLVEQARFELRRDTERIGEEVQRLSGTTRGRMLAIERLKDSGEWAVPIMLEVLRDPSRSDEFALIEWALPQLGRPAVEPLVVAFQQAGDLSLRLVIAEVLGKLGYDAAAPYLLEAIQNSQSTTELQATAREALSQLEHGARWRDLAAAEAYEQLAEQYYAQAQSLMPPAHRDFANIWFWNDQQGLVAERVDRQAYDELLTMRTCERAVKLDPERAAAIALWLSGFFRLEAGGFAQPEYFGPEHADASTYALTAGPQYLHRVLRRALDNQNQAVALAAIEVLRRNSGQQSLLYELDGVQPLATALTFPDRQVRFSAALAIAGALPQQSFPESEQVILTLVQALQQRGERYAMVVEPDQQRRTTLASALREQAGFTQVLAGENYAAVARQVETVPSVDLVILSDAIADPDPQQALEMMRENYQLSFVPTVVLAGRDREALARRLEEQFPFVAVLIQGSSLADVTAAAQRVLQAHNVQPFDTSLADTYATDAAHALERLAVTGTEVFSLEPAEQALIAAIDEPREPIQTAAVETLARMDSTNAQRAVATMALDQQRTLPKRLFALNRLALSAKMHGNLLLGGQIQNLYQIVQDTQAPAELRNLAAEAYGSLNLPSERISQLILDQAR